MCLLLYGLSVQGVRPIQVPAEVRDLHVSEASQPLPCSERLSSEASGVGVACRAEASAEAGEFRREAWSRAKQMTEPIRKFIIGRLA